MTRERDPGRQDGGAAARHRQARGARAHPLEAGPADAGRIPEDSRASAGRRRHHQLGAVPLSVAPLILSHHERWDGKGYPAGLKGEEIPLGARILSVVDYFDALMAERPYHKAMSAEAAIGLLQQEAGKGLDPPVVRLFIELLPAAAGGGGELDQNVRRAGARRPTPQGQPATGLAPEPTKKNVFEDIALAHREIYALYEIAQAMGTSLGVSDTMALISAKLTNLVPFACAALFLFDEETETLRCRFATGTDADVIQQVAVHSGEGLDGLGRAQPPSARQRAARAPISKPPASAHLSTTLQSALVCPLMFNERFIGTLSVYHTDAAFYRDDHRRLLDRVSEQAAAVINNSMLFEQTQEDSLTDPLTGLPNTRFLFMHLTRELARAERLKSEVSLIVMDLDSFKEINDNHGHHVGDRALCEVARVLRAGDPPLRHLRPLRRRRVHRRALRLRRRRGGAQAAGAAEEHRRGLLRGAPGQAAAARHQRRRGGLPAGRRVVRGAARHRRQPHVSGQVGPQAPRRAETARGAGDSPDRAHPADLTDLDIQRAAAGIL